jgi:pimeloyl-ACP methyl ester carboxylesterase
VKIYLLLYTLLITSFWPTTVPVIAGTNCFEHQLTTFLAKIAPIKTGIREHIVQVAGHQLEYLENLPGEQAGKIVIMIHGSQPLIKNGGKRFSKSLNVLAQERIKTFSISLPGHGNSEGSSDFFGSNSVDMLSSLVHKLKEAGTIKQNTEITLVGHSGGGIVAAQFARKNPNNTKLVLVNTPMNLYQEFGQTNSYKGIQHYLFNHYIQDKLKNIKHSSLESRSPALWADEIKTPTLVIQGTQDSRVNLQHTRNFISKQNNTTAHWINNGHDFDINVIINHLTSFIK